MKFIARQPIFTRDRDVFAYELLFRSGIQNSCDAPDLDQASASLFDTSYLMGLQKLTDGSRAFINCPRDFLLRNYITLFPADQIVVELLETIEPEPEVLDSCRQLKQAGYLLALDDFVDAPHRAPLVDLADFIKVDFRLASREEQRDIVSRYAGRRIRMLAEKVETPEEFSEAVKMGYTLFQGYFFCRPEVLQQRSIPASKLVYFELLQAISSPGFNLKLLASKIKHEASLTFKLLRYLNSAAFGFRVEIHSIAQALGLLGEREVRKWIAVVFVSAMADGKPDELLTVPLVRGRFCELLSPHIGMREQSSDLFLLGLLSVMDAILDQPLDLVLEQLAVSVDIKEALLCQDVPYRHILDIALAIERADWETVAAAASRFRVSDELISQLYLAAVEWATALRSGTPTPAR